MSRWASGTNETAADATALRMALLVDLDFASGHLYVHDALGTLTFGGHDYLGIGKFGGLDGPIEDSLAVIARPISLVLSGVDSTLITEAMTEDYQNRAVVIYVGLLATATNTFPATPEVVWEGRMDYMEIELGQNTGTIKVKCEHRLRREPRIARYTDEDQQLAYSGDTFLHLVPHIENFTSQWGDKPSQFSTNSDVTRAISDWIRRGRP